MTNAYITHPDLPGRVVEVPDSAVPHYRATGWELTSKPVPVPKLPANPAEAATAPISDTGITEANVSDPADTTDTEAASAKRRPRAAKES
ncbi:hypothetical protein RVR_5825 [Actinacidiphila reveromycinica]|uniref:Uncharacterized protein n=1 Tax=Actinacidiphila reveromycinica TaxID=659352 RepID=A0A7U3UV10_9ACTN|nr:hypothetical protein [Streptomyces sp. SN-593]BBA99278.1 hypothetical protein RVR_5825 [Streptomyces sp. SN-593]